MTVQVDVRDDLNAVAGHAADRFVRTVRRQLERHTEPVHVVITGGSTGLGVLRAIRARAEELDWSRIHFWWGDERFVAAGHPDRNDVQADEALLLHIPVAPAQVHRVATTDGPHGPDPDAAAEAYAADLARYAADGQQAPLFAVLMLGVGEEGHTASIFPHSPAATDHRPVCAVRNCAKPPPTRITLTFGVLSRAEEVWMMTSGAGKAEPVAAALGGADPVDVPAAGPRGRSVTRWLLDEAAAARLTGEHRNGTQRQSRAQ